MLGGLSVIVSAVVGVVSLVVTSIFGGSAQEPVHETVQAGESVSVTMQTPEENAEPTVMVEKSVREEPLAAAVEDASLTPTVELRGATVLEDGCVSSPAGEELTVSAGGQNVSVKADGAHAEVCASGDEDGKTQVETKVEDDNAWVHLRQNINSSGSVKSSTHVNVSTE
jgi:hypothetical protein